MQASLRRRAIQSTGPIGPDDQQVASARLHDEQELQHVINQRSSKRHHEGRGTLEKGVGSRAGDARLCVAEAAKKASSENMDESSPRSIHPARGNDKMPALGLRPENKSHKHPDRNGSFIASAARESSRLLRPIRVGVLPPGSYTAPKAGYTLIAAHKERLKDLPSQNEIETFPIALVGRGLYAEVEESGLCCVVSHIAASGRQKRRRLVFEAQKSWTAEDIQTWNGVSAAVKEVQAATDRVCKRSSQCSTALRRLANSLTLSQAVYNMEAGRLHISCSSPPEIIFYTNTFDNTPLDLSTVPVEATQRRLRGNANRKACMLSKLVLNIGSGTCSIVCVSESRRSWYKSRRTLRTATLVDLTSIYSAEMRDAGKSNSTWTEEEIRCLKKFLDVRRYWQQYWATERNQGRKS